MKTEKTLSEQLTELKESPEAKEVELSVQSGGIEGVRALLESGLVKQEDYNVVAPSSFGFSVVVPAKF